MGPGGQAAHSSWPCLLSLPLPQENEKSPSQNRKAKDATSDNGKGQESGPPSRLPPPPQPPLPCPFPALWSPLPADGLAYSALLKNELLGAGIEKVQDPQTEDRRLQPSTPEKKGLFTVSPLPLPTGSLHLARPPGSAPHVPLPRSPWEPLNPTPRAKALLSHHEGRAGAGATCRVLSLGVAPAQGWEEPGLGLLRDGQGAGGRRGSREADTGKSLSRRCFRPEACFASPDPWSLGHCTFHPSSSGFSVQPALLPSLRQCGGTGALGLKSLSSG